MGDDARDVGDGGPLNVHQAKPFKQKVEEKAQSRKGNFIQETEMDVVVASAGAVSQESSVSRKCCGVASAYANKTTHYRRSRTTRRRAGRATSSRGPRWTLW